MEANFSLEDFAKQFQMMEQLGIKEYCRLMPWLSDMNDDMDFQRRMIVLKNIIHSMTPEERQQPDRLTPSRCRRISQGSGTPWGLQGQVLKEYFQAKEFADAINRMTLTQKLKYVMSLNQTKPLVDDIEDFDDIDDDDDDLE